MSISLFSQAVFSFGYNDTAHFFEKNNSRSYYFNKVNDSTTEQRLQYSLGSVFLMNISLILPGQEEPANIPERGQT